ncbi:MAG: TrfA family protein [Betaproteobacteria bacterium]|nr:MAG: TrfA family protein [Betaproteobacteria bacterium]
MNDKTAQKTHSENSKQTDQTTSPLAEMIAKTRGQQSGPCDTRAELAKLEKLIEEARQKERAAQAAQRQAAAPQASAKILPFPLGIPDATRPVCNDMARAALFAAIQGKDRLLLENALLATVDGIEIIFSGRQFNQDDHDTLMQLICMAARHAPLGEYVTIPATVILKALGRGTSGKEHEQLKAEIHRLVDNTVYLRNTKTGINYRGHLIDDAIQDEKTRFWRFRLNPKMAVFYERNRFTLIDWEQRINLRGKDLARWLHLYFAGNAAQYPVSVEFLREKSGSRAKSLRHYREKLRLALEQLKAIGFLISWNIDPASDLVSVERVPSPAQQRHIAKKAANKPRPEQPPKR